MAEVTRDGLVTRVMLVDDHEVVRTGLRTMLESCDDLEVVAEAATADDQALFDSIMAGAAGYVLKQIRGMELVDGIRRVARGESLLDPAVTARVLDRLRYPSTHGDARLARLTPTELRIVEMIAEGMTNRSIGEKIGLAEKTIKNYVSSILSKMHMSRRAEAAAYLADRRAREGTSSNP